MASLVNPYNINGNYPIAGQDNDSQGFRDNFTNVRNNFIFIKQEVEDLQSKVILKSALSGSSLDNNFLGSQVKNIQTKNLTETVYDWGEVGAATATEIQLDLALGNIHKINATGSIKINAVIKNFPAALQYTRLLLYINISSVSNTLELPSTLTTDLSGIPGLRTVSSSKLITFTDAGSYIFEFSSVDSGSTIFVRELTKGNPTFRDPNFYMAGIGTFSQPTLRLGWGNLFAVSATIDSKKSGKDAFSVRGSVTSFMNFADGGNDPAAMTQAGFTVAKSRTADPNPGGIANPTESVVNSGDFLGYFNAMAYTHNKDDSNNSYQQLASIGMYATGSNTNYGLGGNIVIATKRDGGVLTSAITINNNQDVVLAGNLTVNGVTTTINSTILTVDDMNIIIAADIASAIAANGAGISVDQSFANIEYVNSGAATDQDDRWSLNKATTIGITTQSNATTNGALVVKGGVGIAGALNVGGTFGLSSTAEATSTSTGAFSVSAGGISAGKNIVAGNNLFANAITTSANLVSGALQVQGGGMIRGNLYVGGQSSNDNGGTGGAQTGLYVLSNSISTNVSSGAVVVVGGMGVGGNVFLSTASSANGVTISSTLDATGSQMLLGNAAGRSSSHALRVRGGSIFEANVVFGIGSSTANIGPGRVIIDNAMNVTTGAINTGGLVLGNSTAIVGMSVSGDINIGTNDSGSVYILNKENVLGTPTSGTLTPYLTTLTGGNPTIGGLSTLGGMNVFNDLYVGQPHNVQNISAGGVWNGGVPDPNLAGSVATNPYYGTPRGASSGNIYLISGARATSATSGALQIKSVLLADGSTAFGGAGIAGNLFVNQAAILGGFGTSSNFANLVAASSTGSDTLTTGALVVNGGMGVAGNINVGGQIKLTTRTLGAFANVGAIEFNNVATNSGVYYSAPADGNRAVLMSTHYFVQNGNVALNNDAAPGVINTFYGVFAGTASSPTNGSNGGIFVPASTTYEFDLKVLIGWQQTPLSHTESFSFGGNCTFTSYNYDVFWTPVASLGTPTAPLYTSFFGTTTMPTAATGVISTANTLNNYAYRVRGIITTNAAGLLVPQMSFSALPGFKAYAVTGSYFRLVPVGTTGNIAVGNFRAI